MSKNAKEAPPSDQLGRAEELDGHSDSQDNHFQGSGEPLPTTNAGDDIEMLPDNIILSDN
ncbi:hypothetical protein ACH41H_48770 [Streptomyces sp. NPDC020800]|uniref:hypothetical protein n=1 Tax=Streptomyces sp. NPDC020800 TaxID=3365092 RepID=UPI00379B6571